MSGAQVIDLQQAAKMNLINSKKKKDKEVFTYYCL